MVKFQTKNTQFSRDTYSQIKYGFPINFPTGIRRVKTILRKLLNLTSINGVMEVNISDDKEENAAAGEISPKTFTVVVSKGALDNSNNEQLAAMLGHELGHIIEDTDDQFSADAVGIDLALKAGFNSKKILKGIQHLRDWTDDNGPERVERMESQILDRSFRQLTDYIP